MLKPKILALDYGQKRIGLATSDALGMCAHPQGFLPASDDVFKNIQAWIDKENIHKIIVGLPISMSGHKGPMALEVENFVEKMKETITTPIEVWDERLTTSQAERMLVDADVKRKKRKVSRDMLAATLILQSYLDCH